MRHYSYIYLVLFVLSSGSFALEAGDTCTIEKTGKAGVCKIIANCPEAIKYLKANNIYPQICAFDSFVPIVCCESKAVAARPPGQKAKEKCADYSQYGWAMKKPPVFVIDAPLQNQSVCGQRGTPSIIGGKKAKPREFPHQALLGYGEDNDITWNSGGSLISERYVLTAGHCLDTQNYGEVTWVRLGDLNIKLTNDFAAPEEYKVITATKHPDFNPPSKYSDIALLKLDRDVTFNEYLRPACLHTTFAITNRRYIATGWGHTKFQGQTSDDLMKVVLDTFTIDECNDSYRTYIKIYKRSLGNGILDQSQVCAGGKNEELDACQGDSGGPLQVLNSEVYCMYNIIGVTSFGKTCGVEKSPGIYTRVSHYIKWIEDIVWPDN